MAKQVCWGIFREESHSPNRISDDAEILLSVQEELKSHSDIEVSLFSAEQLPQSPTVLPDIVFLMCEREEVLTLLSKWESLGVKMVNTPQSVKNTFRLNTFKLLEQEAFFPKSDYVSINESNEYAFSSKAWIKRGDFHAINASEDVVLVSSNDAQAKIINSFKERGINQILIQEHVEGDLIKFYGVYDKDKKRGRWFHWFYHKDQNLHRYSFDRTDLNFVCQKSAEILDLEIYGGDAIITDNGKIFIIDVNAWPSFALFRDTAAIYIADHIASKIQMLSPIEVS